MTISHTTTDQNGEGGGESSLTAPHDRSRDINGKSVWRPDIHSPPLSRAETDLAMKALYVPAMPPGFQKADRVYVDPPVSMQSVGLFSFTPARGAKPDDKGIYGFAKMRGVFSTQDESDHHAEYIIKNVDSYNKVYHVRVGHPYPVTLESTFSEKVEEIDIRKECQAAMSGNIRAKRDKEQQTVNEIKQREANLKQDAAQTQEDPYDLYITLKVKLAQLSFTYLEHQKKMAEVKDIVIKTRAELVELDSDHPDYRDTYFQKYMQARKDSGLKDETPETSEQNFIKYLCQDAELGF
jgi:hypothetical protein